MDIEASPSVLSMPIYAISLLFLVEGLRKNRVLLAFKDT
jgi:hypothetical protein